MSGFPSRTRYANLTDQELNMVFSTGYWERPDMGFEERLEACQELEMRLADRDGTIPRTVIGEDMPNRAYGYQQGGIIALNAHVLRDGTFRPSYDEQRMAQADPIPVLAPNWMIYDTVCHEHQHCVQHDEGRSQGSAYIEPSSEYSLYRIQPCEREAFEAGERGTSRALADVRKVTGVKDPNQEDYYVVNSTYTYKDALRQAQEHYQDPDIQQAVDTVVNDYRDGVSRSYQTSGERAVAQVLDSQMAQGREQGNEAQYQPGARQTVDDAIPLWEDEPSSGRDNSSLTWERPRENDRHQGMGM